uniref:pre-B-cell leukemia homeobox interacting protein 1b isoform X5 n=1 Tax=Gasterosteus aculeatus aculeatus TaxID=481459 RepID=UPI001A99D16C|nr:pre-B-cell leukemia homeobox interacting protein 1b isoform X5 [Gasterosteus aculeatus aculeatus]
MSGGSSANNSWTILTPEETVAETLRPLAEGTDNHGGSLTSAAGCGENRPADCAQSAEGLPVERHLVSKEEKPAELSEDTSTELHRPAAVTDASVPSQSEGLPETTASTGPDADSFSDSYAHVAPSPDEPSASLPSTETLGGVEFTQEEERLAEEGTRHQLDREELQQEGEESDLSAKPTDLWKQAEEGEGRSEKTGEEAEPELRRRRSLLAALERIGRTEEEEEVEEEFRLPQQGDDDNDSGFSVNKCILAVVILIGLGTIFFSGVFMNLDEESEYGTMEQKGAEEPRKREWLNPEVPPLPVDADSSELLNKQQISLLQAQLQEQKAELKVAKLQADEGVKGRLQWEEMEKENTSEAAPAAVKSVTSPPSGHPGNGSQASAGSKERQPKKPWDDQKKDVKKDRIGQKELKEGDAFEWKEGKKRERKDDGKTEWQQGSEQGKFDKEKDKGGKQKHHGEETKQWKDKERKKEKTGREDEGKSWKYKEGKKEWIEKSERKEKEAEDWKKTNRENRKEGKQWRGEEEKKDWKVGKDHAGKHKSKDEWKGEKEWKKGKDVIEASLKKDWKKKGEKKDGDWKSKDGKTGKGKDDRKQRDESKNHGNERKLWNENEQKNKNGKAERKKAEESWKRGGEGDKKPDGDRKRDGSSSHSHRDEHKSREGHRWGDGELPHTHSRASPGQPEYWLQQRLRLQRRPKPPRQCGSAETCARAEGLLPVPFPEFRALLQTYLAKAEEAGVDASEREELDELASEFFRDGVFAHDQTSFREFVDNLEDILEDLVEGDDDDDAGGEDSEAEDEMEEFEREVIERFSALGAAEKVGGSKGEWRKQSGPGRG